MIPARSWLLPQGEGAREFFGFADFFTGSFTGMTKERA
jgi:hypothetical protein